MIHLSSNLRAFVAIFVLLRLVASNVVGPPSTVQRPPDLAGNLKVVSRERWRAREPKNPHVPLTYDPAPYVVIHHGGIPYFCYAEDDCAEIVRSYQNLHMDVRGWNDIGYNFVIGEDGNVYEGRGWDHVGAHAPGYNTQSIGICLIGDFTHVMPNAAARNALIVLIAHGIELEKITSDYHAIGHRQVRETECPGETFYEWVTKMPRWMEQPVPIYSSAVSSYLSTTQSPLASTTEIAPVNDVTVYRTL